MSIVCSRTLAHQVLAGLHGNVNTSFCGAGMFGFFFSEHPVTCFEDAAKYADGERFAKYHRMMLERGIYLAPSMYEAGFTSLAHTEEHVDKTLEAIRDVFSKL